jgi:hypothetical protein
MCKNIPHDSIVEIQLMENHKRASNSTANNVNVETKRRKSDSARCAERKKTGEEEEEEEEGKNIINTNPCTKSAWSHAIHQIHYIR